jgi:hypothetical protein
VSGRGRAAALWLATCLAVALGGTQAHAAPCAPPTPACHLENGKELLTSDPARAAAELLASYRLDERTDTLVLYATALSLDGRYALALDTWKRIIVFRDSELEAAKEAARTATGRRRTAARAAVARVQRQAEQAAEAILKLWPRVARVRVRLAPGQQLAVSHDGVEVDTARDVLVNAGRDELVFTRRDGSVERVPVELAAGAIATIDAPSGAARPATPPPEPVQVAQPRPAPEAAPPLAAARPAPVPPPRPAQPDAEVDAGAAPALAATRFVDEPRSPAMSRVGLGLAAGAVIAGGIAGGFGYLAGRDRDDARAAGCTADGQCPFGPAADLALRANDRARIAQFTAIGAGALLAAGATLWIYGRRHTRRAIDDVALHIGPSSAAIAGRF